MRISAKVYLIILTLIGLGLGGSGILLLTLGGSPYYLIVGLAYIVAAVLAWRGHWSGGAIVTAVAIFTVPWALWESGLNFWALFPRLLSPFALAAVALLFAPALNRPPRYSRASYCGAGVFVLLFAVGFGLAFVPHGVISPEEGKTYKSAMGDNTPKDWTAYGRNTRGLRYSPFDQINRDNVEKLEIAWTYHSGDTGPGTDENTPLQIDDTIYICSRNNIVAALDADTGEERWKQNPQVEAPIYQRCRGLGFYEPLEVTEPPTRAASDDNIAIETASGTSARQDNICRKRIVQTTLDARLIELDAETGERCPQFGDNGVVSLTKQQQMGEVKLGFYFQTSAPLVARDLIVIGGWVRDNQEIDEPSGTLRGFDARNGQLVWAWDLGNPDITQYPPEGESYTRGTPNMWTTAAYDDDLGLIYAPLGNATPDYFGMERPERSDAYSSALVALDVTTGRERWKFQTVHHDIWDYDLPSQPALVDLQDGDGDTIPAVLQTTKRGQVFLLNRETGEPIANVEEKPVPQGGAAPEEELSPTQPYSVGMPTIGAKPLTEKRAWGMTMFDQLACRIAFKKLRYDGDFTPPGVTPALQQPGNVGGMNWGSMSVDIVNNRVFLNDIRIPSKFRLIAREEYDDYLNSKGGGFSSTAPGEQVGTPYGFDTETWMSAFGVPCSQPPFGTITAIDLDTREIAWQQPAGTVEELGPFGLKLGFAMPIGMPAYAGTSTTAGGLVFFAGYQDFYIRAYDTETGELLWEHPLPVGSSATPMTYVSPATGKQYLLLSVGGARQSEEKSDTIIAFTLPEGN